MDSKLFIICRGIFTVVIILDNVGSFKSTVFTKIGGQHRKYDITPITVINVVRPLICGMKCSTLPGCKAMNIIKNINGTDIECELLVKAVTNTTSLINADNSEYWMTQEEESCQVKFGITAAESSRTVGVISYETRIVADHGKNIYKVAFDTQLDVVDISLMSTTTVNIINWVKGVGLYQHQLTSYDNGMMDCEFNYMKLQSVCLHGWPKPLNQSIFGNISVNAFLEYGSEVLAFDYDQIMSVYVDHIYPRGWRVRALHDLKDVSVNNEWRNIPKGVVAASWVYMPDSPPNTWLAFLATKQQYYLYDFVNHKIVKTDQLCPGTTFKTQ